MMPYFMGLSPATYPLLFVSTKPMAFSKASSFDACDDRTSEKESEAALVEFEAGRITPR
jgi:hypothetical protein